MICCHPMLFRVTAFLRKCKGQVQNAVRKAQVQSGAQKRKCRVQSAECRAQSEECLPCSRDESSTLTPGGGPRSGGGIECRTQSAERRTKS